ncbi:MAG TPA: zinc-ribbon domain-containing protein, partial [Ktedonobacterales bacterium]|nr:zinc-ribbon domain-containing protein [Ktedonobacterales bacterium]
MQSAFCTNCGQPLAAGAAFCPSCGTRVEASPAATTASSVPPGTPPYAPGSNPQPSFTPAAPQKNQGPNWLGWLVGCLVAFLAVIVLLIGLVVFGLLTHHLIFFAIGLGGLVVLLLIGAAIEHQVRRLYRRFKYGIEGIERDIGIGDRSAGPRYRGAPRRYQRQPSFSPIRFLFSLAIIAALAYGGLYLYYTQQFVSEWSGVLKIGTAQQGVQANIQISVPLHSPTNPSVNDPPSLAVTQVQFKPVTLQGCQNAQTTYQ